MTFSEWLQNELKKRSWSQREVVRRGKRLGYKLSSGQLSHIISETRQAGPDACIAIAHGLGVSREEVFRARGWLLGTFSDPGIDSRIEQLAHGLNTLPFESREIALDIMEPALDSVRKLISKIPEPDWSADR